MRIRRALVAAITAASVMPMLSSAQQPEKVRRISFLAYFAPLGPKDEEWFWGPLYNRGWRERENIVIERRFASGRNELLKPMAEELVGLRVELIVAQGTVAALAAKSATRTIPIVAHRSGDPVASGLVPSLSRPGGNITGTSTISSQLDAKRIELVRELLPQAKRIGEIFYSPNPVYRASLKDKEDAYRLLGLTPIFVDVTEARELERAIDEVARLGGQALIISTEPLFEENLSTIVAAARRSSILLVGGTPGWRGRGLVVSYGPSEIEYVENLAALIDQILKGAKPGDLPIRQPTKFELAIDLNAAKALGITVPQSVLVRADYVTR
jgi:putative ABC transport system substrate-binding protein